ncbi:MAG: serine hydrolase [Prevotellaceae bacterium]|jgi:CubicO group peptidase (beta-lactamase class C family)/lysophospholipase L1-like esterase|nr:serine hydrolase [Prevotellaceae bacterium]
MKQILSFLTLALLALQAGAQPLQRVAPEEVGMSSRHLLYADQAIERAIAQDGIPGAVLAVVRHGKMAYLKAYGNKRVYPDKEPMSVNTIFDMASCSKPMGTAMSVHVLAERGLIRLVDPVGRYIPGFRGWVSKDGKRRRSIRVVDLLTHTSGLPPYAPAAELQKQYGSPAPDSLMAYISRCRRDFEPQTDFQYSCLNYITLQHIVEKVSGMSLRDFARQNVFGVLGMNHTDYLPCRLDESGNWVNTADAVWASSTQGDWHNLIAPTELQPNGQVLCGQVHDPLARILNGGISGNAGVFSSADDIAVLCAALLNGGEWNGHRVLSPLAVKAMRTVPRATAELGRTLGWDSYSAYASNNGDYFGPNTFGHTGYTGTSIIIDPDNDTAVILLVNAVHPKDEHSMVRTRSLVANAVAGAIFPPERTYFAHYYKRLLQFMDEPAITSKDIVMLGNSITQGGRDWNERIGKSKKHLVNRGISGDIALGVYDRLHQILPAHPAKLFLMIGINDVAHNLTSDSIVTDIRRILERVQTESPQTKVYLQSLLPIDESFNRYKSLTGKTDLVPEINAKLETLADELKIKYIDLFPLFTLKESNVMRKELTTDGLHLNEEGYKVWVKTLKKNL